MSIQTKKLLIVLGALTLIVVLYFQSTHPPEADKKEETALAPADFINRILSQAKSSLKREELEPLKKLEAELEKGNTNNKVLLLDSIAHTWQRLQIPALAAHYFEEESKLIPTEKNEMDAGASYYEAFGIAGDTALKAFLLQSAIRNYEKVIQLNPENLDAKANVAMCYAEGSNPMQGILLLREVVAKNPKNENAQFDLAALSIRSGQFEKAIDRLSSVIEINPLRYDVYFLRGSTYMRLGEKEKAKKDFEKVKKESGDVRLADEAENYISQLNK